MKDYTTSELYISEKVYQENSDETILQVLDIFQSQARDFFREKGGYTYYCSTFPKDNYPIFEMSFCDGLAEKIYVYITIDGITKVITPKEHYVKEIIKNFSLIDQLEYLSITQELQKKLAEKKRKERRTKNIKSIYCEQTFLNKFELAYFYAQELTK